MYMMLMQRDPNEPIGTNCCAWSLMPPPPLNTSVRVAVEADRRNPGWGHYNEFLVDGQSWDESLPWFVNLTVLQS